MHVSATKKACHKKDRSDESGGRPSSRAQEERAYNSDEALLDMVRELKKAAAGVIEIY